VSAIITIIIIEYFVVQYPPLTAAKVELQLWGSIVYIFVFLFGYITLIVNHARRLMDPKRTRRTYLSGFLIGAVAVFLILGLTLPGGSTGLQYSNLYKYVILYIGGGMYSAWAHHPYNCYRYLRFSTVQSTLFFITWLFLVFRELSVIVAVYPPIYGVGTWIEQVISASAERASLACAGVGTLILGIRALATKEPGLIEMEVT
jgi:hypothetical protein